MELLQVIDSCVLHEWGSPETLGPYLSADWRRLLVAPASGPVKIASTWLTADPLGSSPAASQAPESDLNRVLALLDRDGGTERAVLGYSDGLLSTVFSNHYVAQEITRAANDWTAAEWLERDERLFGLILVSSALPERAAAEIERAGANERMVGVALGGNGLGRPFGHPAYDPIYRAAAQLGLPLVLQVGSDASTDSSTPPVAGGLPATQAEHRALAHHTHMSHIASMIVQGVFHTYPQLRVLLVGGGAAWIPPYVWRLDYWYKMLQQEAPWLTMLPSEYFVRHVRVATHGLERPDPPEQLSRALSTLPEMESILLYASCFPSADSQAPDAIIERLPHAWGDSVLRANAESFFRWPAHLATAGAPPRAGVDSSSAQPADVHATRAEAT
jgi:predicted TIM-barrel fold metal-dependent hydrolase